MDSSFIESIQQRAYAARAEMARNATLAPWVDDSLPIPRPYLGSGKIRLVIVGQDPTVQNPDSRAGIATVLNLDHGGSLRRYLQDLCTDLGLTLARDVYATNACKCFFTAPPTSIKKESGVDLLESSAPIWLPVLQRELDPFPEATVISLGEPVLQMLVRDGSSRKVRDYWGYHEGWRAGQSASLRGIEARESMVERAIFPFVHQPSQRNEFYRVRRPAYIALVRSTLDVSKLVGP